MGTIEKHTFILCTFESETEKEAEKETETDRKRQRQTDRERNRQTEKVTEIEKEIDRQWDRKKNTLNKNRKLSAKKHMFFFRNLWNVLSTEYY
jgi:hypothetical protein